MIRINFVFFIFFLLTGCFSSTKQEKILLERLRNRHPDYKIEPFNRGLEDVYLTLTIKKSIAPDSISLKEVYYDMVNLNTDSANNPLTPWLYIIVYNHENEYLFTMRDFNGTFKMYKDSRVY